MEKNKKPADRTIRLFVRMAKLWEPTPDLTVSQWADEHRILTSETSAEPGRWRTDRAPYQREIMDSVTDKTVEEVAVMSSSQVGKTEFMLNMVGYHIDQDPCPIAFMLPIKELITSFSQKRLTTMIQATPSIRSKVKEAKGRDAGNTIAEKSYAGGYIALVGANSPANLSSRPIRVVLCDEVDRYPTTAGTEGDPISLILKRTTTFWNRKHVFASTPLTKGTSRIEQLYEDSTMEQWHLPCPSCEEGQPLSWKQIKYEHKTSDSGEFIIVSVAHACKACGALHSEREWKQGTGKWVARKKHTSRRGFHLNQLVSPWSTWEQVVKEFLVADREGPEKLKVWVNTVLGETWEERGTGVETDELLKHREQYVAEVPENVLLLTCGVDVQDNRLEYEIVGWGPEAESWGIRYGVIMGDPGKSFVWNMLNTQVVNNTFQRADGQKLQVMTTCVDSGGHYTKEVYTYCKSQEARRVWAIKGKGGSGRPFIMRPKKRNEEGAWLFIVGVDVGKDTLTSRLTSKFYGPGYCHFPIDDAKTGYDEEYYTGLTSEHRVMRYILGRPSFHWEKKLSGGRNEPLDCRNYAMAALEIMGGLPVLEALQRQRDRVRETITLKVAKPAANVRRTGVVSKGIEI